MIFNSISRPAALNSVPSGGALPRFISPVASDGIMSALLRKSVYSTSSPSSAK